MTDLERVREWCEKNAPGNLPYLDAHLKEDEERQHWYMETKEALERTKAELARLHDNLYQAQRQVKVSKDD